jgi:hypothetical protein
MIPRDASDTCRGLAEPLSGQLVRRTAGLITCPWCRCRARSVRWREVISKNTPNAHKAHDGVSRHWPYPWLPSELLAKAELWRPLPRFQHYLMSTHGRVWSTDRMRRTADGRRVRASHPGPVYVRQPEATHEPSVCLSHDDRKYYMRLRDLYEETILCLIK